MHELDPTCIPWRKSRHSSGNGACVEVAHIGRLVAVRDSKNPDDRALLIDPCGWQDFLTTIKKRRS